MKKVVFILIVILVFIHPLCASAVENVSVTVLGELELPSDLNFTVNDTCTGHAHFQQAAANENGMFAVYSWHHNPNNYKDFSMTKAYIDIYRADGSFCQELAFTSTQDFSVELTEETVNIYSYLSVLVYDLQTQELHHYSIEKGSAQSSGLNSRLRSARFTCGDWDYECKKSYMGYGKLIRSNHKEKQVLVEMAAANDMLWKVTVPGAIVGIGVFVLFVYLGKRRKGQGDGLREPF